MKKLVHFLVLLTVFTFQNHAQENWQILPSGTNYLLNGVFFIDADTGYAVGYNASFDAGIALKTTDGGNNWSKLIESANPMFSVFFTDARTGYITTAMDTILKTTDAGAYWSKYPINMGVGILTIHFYNSTTGYAAGMNMSGTAAVFTTTDAGDTWTPHSISPPEHYRINSLFCTTDDICYLAGGYALKTTDGGNSWDSMTTASNSDWSGVYFTSQANGIIVGGMASYGTIDRTTDGGNLWSNVYVGSKFIYSVDFVDADTGFAVGEGGIILKTTDGAINWNPQTSPVVDNLNSVHFPVANIGYAVGDNGTIIKYYLNGEVTHTFYVDAGWNLLSIPLIVSNGVKTSLFPTATSDAFIYEGFYTAKETLENGYGFWLKFENPEIIQITGDEIQGGTIGVSTGWNMIGSLTEPILVDSIKSEPPGIVASEYFYYDGVYQSSDTIKPGLGYWVKVNQAGSIMLSSGEITCPSTVGYGGKTYNTVQIGSQCWLNENLDVGTMINGSQDASENGTIEKYCYNDNPTNCETYGGLYLWDEAMQYTISERAQGICPLGWHLPTLAEYQTLSTYVGENSNALKAIGQGTGDGAGTNTSGFTALLGGYRDTSGVFGALNILVLFWSSSEHSSSIAYDMRLNYNHTEINLDWNAKNYGWYVRCLKD